MFIAFIIIGLMSMFIVIVMEKTIANSNIFYNEKKEQLDVFIKNNYRIEGKFVECIILNYKSGEENKTEYLPVISCLDKDNQEKLIACKAVEEFKIFNNLIKYPDLGKRATICIDRNKLERANIDLENGYFLGKKYSNKEIEIGDYIQARKGIFIRDQKIEAMIYLMEDEHQINKYINEILVSQGVILNIDGEDYITKTINNLKKVIKLIKKCIYIFLAVFLGMVIIFLLM